MAPTARKARDGAGPASSSKKRPAPAASPVDDKDDALLDQRSKARVWDSLVTLSMARWTLRQLVRLVTGRENSDKPPSESKRRSEKPDRFAKEALLHWFSEFKVPTGLVAIFVLTCAIIAGGERFTLEEDRPLQVMEDYYGVLGVPRDADTADVKRAYKTLAKRWHPDRNPNCSSCQDTFSKIAAAYETLSDGVKRAAYDESGDIATKDLKSARSVPLNRENFDELVTFSNDVWIVQIFKPDDSACASFHPFWESQIQNYGHLVRFGRVDVTDDRGKWLPVKYRVLPMVLKYARHLGSPEILPITAMHDTHQQLSKFILTSFPNIGLPLHVNPDALQHWLKWSTRRHKVLFAIPGKSEEERYRSHLTPKKLAARWSEIFEFRTADLAVLQQLPAGAVSPAVLAMLPPANATADSGVAFLFPAAAGSTSPTASQSFRWPVTEEELVWQLLRLAELAVPALSAQSADLLCRSMAIARVYCLVLVDPAESLVSRVVSEVQASRDRYTREIADIKSSGGDVTEDEGNFIFPVLRLYRHHKLQPSITTCHTPRFAQVEKAVGGAGAFLIDFDQGRVASLRGLTSFFGIYPQIAYEDSLQWVDDALHPFLSLPDCNEGLVQHLLRSARSATPVGLVVQLLTALVLAEVVAKSAVEQSLKWSVAAACLVLLVLLQSPWFLRQAASYLPEAFFAPTLIGPS